MMKQKLQALTRRIQKNFVAISLFFIYIIGVGITLIFVVIFNRKLLRKQKNKDTFWKETKGYEPNINDATKQL